MLFAHKITGSAGVLLILLNAWSVGAEASEPRRLPPVNATVSMEQPLTASNVVGSSFVTPVQGLSFGAMQPTDTRMFAVSNLGKKSAAQLRNNFTADPEFLKGIVVVGQDTALKIGGYVKADLIKDFDPINSTDSFVTSSIPVGAPPRENSRFHARQSRFSFDTRWRIEDDVARVFVETDFFGQGADGSDCLRLRHAYGTLGRFTAGQTWTTFTDPSAVPQTLDNEGSASNVNRRQGLVRWTQPISGDDLTFAVALENPQIIIDVPAGVTGDERTESPDCIGRLRLEREWGEFQVAGVVRELGFQPTGQAVLEAMAWGFNFTGSFLVLPRTKAYYQVTFGDGIGSYRGAPDVVPTGPNSAAILPMFGWMTGVKQQWSDQFTSNFTFSRLSLDDVPMQDPNNLYSTTYLAVNLIQNPCERVFWGVEYLYGIRENVSRAEQSANRLQISFGFFLP